MRHLILIATTLLSTCGATMAPPATGDSTGHPARLETPAYDTDEHIIEYNGFTVSYNHTTLVPNWVAYELTAEELEVKYDSRSSNFSRDPNLRGKQASREDYSHSGWDKGHMAPKADLRWSEQSYWQSHYFPNICPQNHQLNGGDWNTLEKTVRRWAKQYGRVWIVCGPVFDSCRYGTIGQGLRCMCPTLSSKHCLSTTGKATALWHTSCPTRASTIRCATMPAALTNWRS